MPARCQPCPEQAPQTGKSAQHYQQDQPDHQPPTQPTKASAKAGVSGVGVKWKLLQHCIKDDGDGPCHKSAYEAHSTLYRNSADDKSSDKVYDYTYKKGEALNPYKGSRHAKWYALRGVFLRIFKDGSISKHNNNILQNPQ